MKRILLIVCLSIFAVSLSVAQNNFVIVKGTNCYFDQGKLPAGKDVVAKNQTGMEIARTTVTTDGAYNLTLYKSVSGTAGVLNGDIISLYVDGKKVQAHDAAGYPFQIEDAFFGQMEKDFDFTAYSGEIMTSPLFCVFSGNASLLNCAGLPVNTEVEVYFKDKRGELRKIGETVVTVAGSYIVSAFGDFEGTGLVQEGAVKGDTVYFYVDGQKAEILNGSPVFGEVMQEYEVNFAAVKGPLNSPAFCRYFGNVKRMDGTKPRTGTVVKAYDAKGVLCGITQTDADGQYSMMVTGNYASSACDEGAEVNETVVFYLLDTDVSDAEIAVDSTDPISHKWINMGDLNVNLFYSSGYTSNVWSTILGDSIKTSENQLLVRIGTVISAYYKSGSELKKCGEATVTRPGSFEMMIYGDDPKTAIQDGPAEYAPLVFKDADGRIGRVVAAAPASMKDTLFNQYTVKIVRLEFVPPVGVDEPTTALKSTRLDQNYPNPFNGTTTLSYAVEKPGKVSLRIYNMLGEEVITLVDKIQNQGEYKVVWHGVDKSGRSTPTGMYFYQMTTQNQTITKRMMYLK